MPELPLMVSVIIPNYNHAVYLQQRIESVLNQTWQDFTVIILDDCSTDNSREIIEKFRSHQKVSAIVYNSVNSGSTFNQWLAGIKLAQTEFIWLAESDDWCEPSFLENIINGMMPDPECVVGFCQSYCITGDNIIKWKSDFASLADIVEGKEFVRRFMIQDTAIFNASMAVWRRSAFERISPAFTKFRFCGDWLFWIEICRQGNVYISGKLLNYFRKHDADVSSVAYRSGDNFIEELGMFLLLHERRWIKHNDLLRCFKKEYVHYKAVEKSIAADKRKQVEALFYGVPGARQVLKNYYRGFYVRYGINKVLGILKKI